MISLVQAIIILLSLVISYLLGIAIRNYRCQQFFQKKSPKLPLAKGCNIFSGNAYDFVYSKDNVLNGTIHHQKLGHTFGLYYCQKPLISTMDLDLIKRVVIDEPDDHINRMPPGTSFEIAEEDNIMFAFDDQWRRIRKAVAPAFSIHKIKTPNVQEEIQDVINRFLESVDWKLDKAKEEKDKDYIEVDVDTLFQHYALDLVFSCFYKQPNVIDYKAEKDYWFKMADDFSRTAIDTSLLIGAMFPITRYIIRLFIGFRRAFVFTESIMSFIDKQTNLNFEARKIAQVQNSGKNFEKIQSVTLDDGSKFKRNMMDYVIDRYYDKTLTQREYFHTSWFIFLAGFKTSGDALSRLVYFLANHPEVQNKLRNSILVDGIDSEYLTWTIYESMRLRPPALIGSSRIITRDMKTKDGIIIPAGTFIHTPNFLIHQMKEYWGEDADKFRPERWANSKNFHPAQYLAFGVGKRKCPGEGFALNEMRQVLNTLLRRYEFIPSNKTDNSLPFTSPMFIFTNAEKPIYVKISRLNNKS